MTRRLNLPLNLMMIPSQSNDSSPQSDDSYPALESRVRLVVQLNPTVRLWFSSLPNSIVRFLNPVHSAFDFGIAYAVRLDLTRCSIPRVDSGLCWPPLSASTPLRLRYFATSELHP
jgi:hypothetical protein